MARVRLIRRRVVASTVALFVAVWLLIAVTLVSGHDPALAQQSAKGSSSTTKVSSASTGSGATTPNSSSSGSGVSSSGSVGAVTTSQS